MNATSPTTAWQRLCRWCLWLGVLLLLALALRLAPQALTRAPWMDEAATTIYSLGNSSRSLPVNRLVDLEGALAPLTGSTTADPGAVVRHLLTEDNHPPLFFLLAHGWSRRLQPAGGVASLSRQRLLPVLLGAAAVPLSLWTGWLALGTGRGALLAGLWMAISPLAVAQSLEVRHYSLAILLTAASQLCFVQAWRCWREGRPLPWPWLLSWIGINAAGICSHYFFVFALLMEVAATAVLMRRYKPSWVALTASLATAALWLPVLMTFAGSNQSSWLRMEPTNPAHPLGMLLQALLGVLFNAVAPGTAAVHGWQWPWAITTGLATLIGLALLWQLTRTQATGPLPSGRNTPLWLFVVLVGCGLAVQTGISLLLMSNYAKGFRYSFFLIPPSTALLASVCESAWVQGRKGGARSVIALLSCALICSLGVDAGVVLPKWYQGDLLVERIARDSEHPIVLAYDENPVDLQPTVIGHEPLSVAWWIAEHPDIKARLVKEGQPLRLVVAIDGPGMPDARRLQARAAIATIKTPIDLWAMGGRGGHPEMLSNPRCRVVAQGSEGSHAFIHFRCQGLGHDP